MEEAFATVARALTGRVVPLESVPVRQAGGRILGREAVSRLDLPPFDKSAMDGYAVMAGDERESYRVLETIPAGRAPTVPLEPGTATKVMTGAPVPEGAGRVIKVEETDGGDETVRVFKHPRAGNICPKGEDVRVGQALYPGGTKLHALAVANLVACGVASVEVRQRVRVAILATGSEIVALPKELSPGKIMDSNSPMLAGLAEENDLKVTLCRNVRDDVAVLGAAIEEAAGAADLVLLSGGVSVGDFDFVPDALQAQGFAIHFDSVAMKPGRPLTFATRERGVALGMPGNPVSVFVGFHLFVRRVAALLGGGVPPLRSFEVCLASELKRERGGRASFRPGRINDEGQAEPVPYHGSAHLLAVSCADGFIEVPKGVTAIAAGGRARFYPLALGRW